MSAAEMQQRLTLMNAAGMGKKLALASVETPRFTPVLIKTQVTRGKAGFFHRLFGIKPRVTSK